MALLLLAGCAAGGVQTLGEVHRVGVPSLYGYGAAGRDFKVVVLGNPFPVPQETTEQAIVAAMQGSHHLAPTNFTTRPGPSAREAYRIVMMFDPPTGLNAARLCGPVVQLPPAQATGERLRLHAAFCVNETILSDAWGSAPRVRDPADPAFRRLVSQLTFELLPARDPYDREDRLFCRPPFCS